MTPAERRLLILVARCLLASMLRREWTGYSELHSALEAVEPGASHVPLVGPTAP